MNTQKVCTKKYFELNYILILFVAVMLTSCASTLELAQKESSSGNYDKAISLYEQVLSNRPDDNEARAGLSEARAGWVSKNLIQVRLLRLANNMSASEDLLVQVIRNENVWGVFPQGAAFSTQAEELTYFKERVIARILKFVQDGYPLRAEFELQKNESLFTHTLKYDVSNLAQKIRQRGHKYCLEQSRSLQKFEYYSAHWLNESCKNWGVRLPELKMVNSVQLFSDIQFDFSVDFSDQELEKHIAKSLSESFKQSKWLDPGAKKPWAVTVTGEFLSRLDKKNVTLKKDFTVQVPYRHSYTKVKEPSPEGVFAVLDLISKLSSDDNEVDNGDGTVTVTETRYRDEYRIFEYPAVEHKQNKQLKLTLSGKLDKENFRVEYENSFDGNTYEHNADFADINLRPEKANLMSDGDWVKMNGPDLFNKLSVELSRAWVTRFCNQLSENNKSKYDREIVMRCLYGLGSQKLSHIDHWLQDNFKLSTDEFLRLTDKKLNMKVL